MPEENPCIYMPTLYYARYVCFGGLEDTGRGFTILLKLLAGVEKSALKYFLTPF